MIGKDLQTHFASKFIVLDGPDGCGKTAQLGLLAKYLQDNGVRIVQTNDPGGTTIGNQIRRLLKYDAQGSMDVWTEVMLFMASRAQLVAEIIRPALESGKTVICDRFISSTCAYQGGSGYPVDKIIELGRFAVGNFWPDLTIIIDIPVEEGLKRTGKKPGQRTIVNHRDANQSHLFANAVLDRFDSRPVEYHRKVRQEFLRLPEYYPGAVRIIDGSRGDIQIIQKRVIDIVTAFFLDNTC